MSDLMSACRSAKFRLYTRFLESDIPILGGSEVRERRLKTQPRWDIVRGSYRLFMVPGMDHCGGGDGPNTFDSRNRTVGGSGQGARTYRRFPAERWQGHPEPFPEVAVYNGAGGTDSGANFSCAVHK